jgi:hypothetical protein
MSKSVCEGVECTSKSNPKAIAAGNDSKRV